LHTLSLAENKFESESGFSFGRIDFISRKERFFFAY